MAFISFSLYKAYYLFILIWAIDFISLQIKEKFDRIFSTPKVISLIFEFLNVICFDIADLLAGLLVLYTYFRIKTKKQKQIEESNSINKSASVSSLELIYTDLSVKTKKYRFIFLISILDFIGYSTDFFYFLIIGKKRVRNGEISWLVSIDFLSRMAFAHFILKSKIYRHHKLSIILIVICLCIMSTTAFITIDDVDLASYPYFFFLSGKFILVALEDVINKILLTEKFMLAHALMFMRGIVNMFIIIILLIIFKLTNIFEFSLTVVNEDADMETYIKILLLIAYIILKFLKSLSIMKVIYNFTPQHVSFLNVVFYLYVLLRCRFNFNDSTVIIVLDVISMTIIILSTLIFNEIIILKFFGLNTNTQVGFLKKEEKEIKEMKRVDTNEDEDDDSDEDPKDEKENNLADNKEYHNV